MHWSPHSCCWGICVDWCLCVCIAMWHAALAPDLSSTSLHCALSSGQLVRAAPAGIHKLQISPGIYNLFTNMLEAGKLKRRSYLLALCWVLAGELQKCRLEVSEYGIAFTFCFNFYVNLATLTSPCVTWWLNFHLKLITEHLGWGNLHNIFRV